MSRSMRAQEPVAPYVADDDRKEAKLFQNGRSQAIRLPKEFRMPGDRVLVHREGHRLIVEPVADARRDALGHRIDLWDDLDDLCGGISAEGWDEIDRVSDDDPYADPYAERSAASTSSFGVGFFVLTTYEILKRRCSRSGWSL